MNNPDIGDEKKRVLRGVRVYEFHIGKELLLLAYEMVNGKLLLIMISTHENYYRDLERYL